MNLQSHLVRSHGELLSGDKKGKPSQPTITTALKIKFPFGSPEYHQVQIYLQGPSPLWCGQK